MSNKIIEIENLGKKYNIRSNQKEKYASLRDVITYKTKNITKTLLYPCSSKKYAKKTEEFWALKNVSFEVNRGEVIGIIGRNGAGKTTLLKILSRITGPTTGRIRIKGRVASLLEVGTGFHPELTGRENIYLNGAILGMNKDEIRRKFDEIVDFSEVEKFLDVPIKRYSSGMTVRLAFAVAAHLEPEILLIDEVLAVGDYQFQKKCLGKMGDVANEGRTVLFVSHNMGVVKRLCFRAIWLSKGNIKETGDTSTICDKYLCSDIGFGLGKYEFDDGKSHPFHFLSLELRNSKGELSSVFNANEPVRFRIIYKNNRSLNGLSVALNITDPMGGSLWAISDLDLFPELYEERSAGTWVYECTAPGNVLRPGTYMVALGAGRGGQYFHHPAPVPFEISPIGYWRKSHKFFGISGGPISIPMEAKKPIEIKPI